jgi:hypothetical protein
MNNAFSVFTVALGVAVIAAIIKEYIDDKRKADDAERAERREVLRMLYEAEDEQFRRQLAREQTFRDAAREEASA